ncbi:hypothetical protein [Janthinobacterium sp.]|uniref:hypothetical protein n=1 Tax=Janthinobacterium sp. TaxID=1871054 RepID=UPI0026130EB4|nr:hypothetical protein [Janthinobacterium sp.]
MKTQNLPALLRAVCVGALLLATSACSAPAQDSATPATPAPTQAALQQQIQSEVGNAACDSTAQCQTIAIGAKSCGGPESYLAWSSKNNDGKKLKALAYAQAEAQRRQQQNDGMLSTCSIITDPGASCVAGRCELQKPGLNHGSAL